MNTFRRHGDSRPCKQRLLLRTPIAAAVAAALYMKQSLPVYAADSAADQPVTTEQPVRLEEVIVSGTRRSEDIQNVPFNIAAINSDLIQEMQAVKLDDIAAYLPGVSIFQSGAFQTHDIIIRGLNVASLDPAYGGGTGAGGAVATYLGEVPLYFDFRTLDLDRVEALLGPQGTLYGAGTLGGVIRYVPKQPNLSNFEAEVHLRGTDQEHAPQGGYDVDGVVNVPLIDGTLGFRAVVGYYHDPGFIDDTRLVRVPGVSLPQPNFNNPTEVASNLYTQRGVNFDHTLTARAELLYKLNDSFDAQFMYLHERTSTDGTGLTTSSQPGQPELIQQVNDMGPFTYAVRTLETSQRTVDLYSLVLSAHLGFADLTSASSYSKRVLSAHTDLTDGYLSYTSYANFPKFVAYETSTDITDTFVEELRLVSNPESRLKYIVGGFYQYYHRGQPGSTYTPGLPAFLGIDRPDDLQGYSTTTQYFSDKAVFGEVGYQFTPAWQMTVGGRWFKDATSQDAAFSNPLTDTPPSPPDGLNLIESHTSGPSIATTLYKFNTSYRFTPDVMAYATVGDGYRAGGLNSLPPCPPGVQNSNCLPQDELVWKPDRTRNYEMGIRSTWFDKRLLINFDYYYIKWTDLRIPQTNQFNVTYLTNGSGAKSYGLETQFQVQLMSYLLLFGSYTHADAYMTAVTPGILHDQYGSYDAEPGDRLPNSPRDFGGLHLRYSRNLPGDYGFYATYGVKAQGNIYSSIGLRASGEVTGGYAVHDASLGLKKNNWEAAFFVENLLNKYAFTGIGIDRSWEGLVENGVVTRQYYHGVLPPRLFGLELTVHVGPH